MAAPAVLLLAALAACGPVPVDQAERSCLRALTEDRRPRNEVAVGVGASRGNVHPYASIRLEVSPSFGSGGRDPSETFNRCVVNRSGRMPTVPLYDQPGWRG